MRLPVLQKSRAVLWLASVALAPAAFCASPGAGAEGAYPVKPIRIIVPISPGSATDMVVRVVAERLQAALGQAIVVENRVGAGTTIGTAAVAREAPDGYTLLAQSTAHTVIPWIYPRLPYKVDRDFAAVATLATLPNVLVAPEAKGYRTVRDLVRAAKARPGVLNYGSAGRGTSTHLAAEKFRLATGIAAVHVPYKGTPEALNATIAGDVDYFFAPITSAMAQVQSGKLVALGVAASDRAPAMPGVPTLSEAGISNANIDFWIGLLAPAGTPAKVIERLNREVGVALSSKSVADRLAGVGATPRVMSPRAFDDLIRKDLRANGELVKKAAITAD